MNQGFLGAVVWAPYVGLTVSPPGVGPVAFGEPIDDPNYGRGLISWRTQADGLIVGSAQILVPKGVYTHVVFFSGPARPHGMMGVPQVIEHPIVFDRPGVVELDPIGCGEYLPRASE